MVKYPFLSELKLFQMGLSLLSIRASDIRELFNSVSFGSRIFPRIIVLSELVPRNKPLYLSGLTSSFLSASIPVSRNLKNCISKLEQETFITRKSENNILAIILIVTK